MTQMNTALPTTIAALGSALPPAAERLTAKYDAAKTNPLDIRGHQRPVEATTQAAVAERLRLLDEALQPEWTIARLKASIPTPPRVDVRDTLPVDGLRRSLSSFAEATRILPADARDQVTMMVKITAPLTGRTQVDAELEADAVTPGDRRRDVDAAVYVLTQVGTRAWGVITRELLGPWVLASGVTELRITGRLGRNTATRR